ncbi:hypothetical protein AMS68_007637 [Peltaster fructicola]|uniref:Apple domain-containing protein n=1 Tax=Peltaster fructicola TaxID=286661 RepID=A0A6H0Y694_9PEZI|nr:hypothetical protein AMS68_007637 [Peltaster fructicola]
MTTITVHTSSGFTPIRCNAAYYNPTVTVTSSTYTNTNPAVSVVRGSLSTSYTTAYSYIYNTVATVTDSSLHYVTEFPTVTVTETRTDPTSTVYDACATNNFASQLPGGGYIGKTNGRDATVYGTFVPSVDAVDCCAQCQALLNCTGSAYNGVFYQYYPCQLFIKTSDANQTCDATGLKEQAYQSYPEPVISISNSGCGQYELLN